MNIFIFIIFMIEYYYFLFINKMEIMFDSSSNMYEVEKIINCKTFRNKKYYLIKWLCYPINECTWEPKSSLKHLNYLVEEFEAGYPFSIDQEMYNIFCEEVKKQKKFKNKCRRLKVISKNPKLLSKKKKIEYFSDSDLNDTYLDMLKIHLHININKKRNKDLKTQNDNLIIDLTPTNTPSEEININNSSEELNSVKFQGENEISKLIIPKLV